MASNYYAPGTVTPECEVVSAEGELQKCYTDCQKNPGHENFICVNECRDEELPAECRTPQAMEDIVNRCILTTRVKVPYTSARRPKFYPNSDIEYPYSDLIDYTKGTDNSKAIRFGTGSIVETLYHQPIRGKDCPCHVCRESETPETTFWWVRARTATHVIHDAAEAERAQFECFYDSDDREKVKTIYGMGTFQLMNRSDKTYPNDVCDVLCVTHDHQTVAILHSIIPGDYFLNPTAPSPFGSKVIISHPHGCSKNITKGDVLYLTVPISQDYPRNTPIPFKEDATYRPPLTTGKESDGHQENQTQSKPVENGDEDNAQSKTGNELPTDETNPSDPSKVCSMKERLDNIKYRHYSDETVENLCPSHSDTVSRRQSIVKYLGEFYLTYTKEQVLKGLVTSAMLHHKKSGVRPEDLITKSYEEVFRVFLGKEYKVNTLNKEDVTGKGNESINSRLRHWVHLLNESNRDFIAFKTSRSNTEKREDVASSIVASWFTEAEKIMEEMLSKLDDDQQTKSIKDLIPDVTDDVIVAGLDIISQYEKYNIVTRDADDDGDKPNCDDKDTKGEEANEMNSQADEKELEKEPKTKDETSHLVNDEWTEDVNVHDKDGGVEEKYCGHDDDPESVEKAEKRKEEEDTVGGQDTPNENRSDEKIMPKGSTFTLPTNAEYAFRVYPRSTGWVSFPPGTVMTSPDGTQTSIEEPRFEFKQPSLRPEQTFVTYDTPTCKGSSGATVYCDMLGQFLGTYFPHSGHVEAKGLNQSGIRDNFVTLYSKSSIFTRDSEEGKKPPRIIEETRRYLSSLRDIMKRT